MVYDLTMLEAFYSAYKGKVEPQYLKISGLVQSNFYRIN